MTNQIAVFLGIVLLAGIGWDMFFNDGDSLLFLAKKFADMLEWVAFWR